MKIFSHIARLMLLTAVLVPDARSLMAYSRGEQDPDCMDCHRALMDKSVVHEVAADACDNCHMPTGAPHPGEDTAAFTLMDRIPDLCFYCHEGPTEVSHPHAPVEKGACLDCHEVHASSEYGLLKKPEQELCLTCHSGSGTDPNDPTDIRTLITGLHQPHSAIAGGGCISCHLPHGSEQRALLVAPFAEDTYVQADPENFELCFLCHDPDLMAAEETEWATGFRNGTRNLHQLHIQGNKGRNCRLCHNMHGSVQPFLIEEKVPFGSWQMGIRFNPEENGGSCQPGCHKMETYVRIQE